MAGRIRSSIQNLIDATEIGTRFLDVGRPLADFTHKLNYDEVERDARKVLRDLATVQGALLRLRS